MRFIIATIILTACKAAYFAVKLKQLPFLLIQDHSCDFYLGEEIFVSYCTNGLFFLN